MADARATLKKLLALAMHEGTPVEEARTAAFAALQLVKRKGWQLAVREPPKPAPFNVEPYNGPTNHYHNDFRTQPPPEPKPKPPPKPYATPDDFVGDPWWRHYYAAAAASAGWRPEHAPSAEDPFANARAASARGGHADTGPPQPRRGRFANEALGFGTCATCGEQYTAQMPVWYDAETRQIWHADCRDPLPKRGRARRSG